MSVRQPCRTSAGRHKLVWFSHAAAKRAARKQGTTFDGKKKLVYRCDGCGNYHLATR